VRGRGTASHSPFTGGIGIHHAVIACVSSEDSRATFTLLHDGVAGATVEGAAVLGHESALLSRLYRLTDHWNHLPSNIFSLWTQKTKKIAGSQKTRTIFIYLNLQSAIGRC
jgi:hypothetical protein